MDSGDRGGDVRSRGGKGSYRTGTRQPGAAHGGRVTLVDGLLAVAVLLGLVLNAGPGWWWADPVAGYVLAFYAGREVRKVFFGEH